MSRPPELTDAERAERSRLLHRLEDVSLADARRYRRRLHRATAKDLPSLDRAIGQAADTIQRRRERVPQITFPDHLPVTARRDDIAEAIKSHQVVVVAGETGSGKTTQIPKICLELGRGVRGMIGHTQPRRLAARTVAERIADELDTTIGGLVGSTVRFDDRTSSDTAIKLMTDGILLAEIRRDRLLLAYDTIIIDEAHERSLNIDFLLGYLARLLPKRPDLKVIVTSATIDPERFARHFADAKGQPAPIIEVSGRTFPVEIRYRPLQQQQGDTVVDLDPLEALADAVSELLRLGDGDVLVFLSGEREIRDAEEVLRGRKFRNTEIFPLFARLTAAEQHKAYRQHSTRRVVLSTNIAETSVTVPGIRYVVDTGLARISRYSTRTKVQRLPIEPISQASARQRAGRCGRVADGVCIRLYSEDDFLARPEFTDPEIVRTNLASVILSMADLDLGAVDEFPFVDPPDHKAIKDGRLLLTELGALSDDEHERPRLTRTGRDMAALPLDPKLARMLVEAHRLHALNDVIIIVAALTVQDVRERPADEREQADAYHRRFADKSSDFLSYLNLWRYLTEQRQELSGSAFRKMCKAEYLHWLRIREWQDLTSQLSGVCRDNGWHPHTERAAEDDLHKALLSGLLGNIGMRVDDTRQFLGARGVKFHIFPGSDVAKKPPRWVMAAELVETSRLWARDVARIDPMWLEKIASHLVKRQYSEPHWSSSQGAAMAYEKVLLYGLPVVEKRRIPLNKIDPSLARELLVRHGIVEGGWTTRIPVLLDNAQRVAEARELETRSRRRDLVVDDEALVALYLDRLPADITTGRHLEAWWKKTGKSSPETLQLTESDIHLDAHAPSAADFPPLWKQGDRTFDLHYTFDPGIDADGVTVQIPLAQLPTVSAAGFEWLVPGLRPALYTEMLRTLPKYLRRLCSPPAEYAELLTHDVTPRSAPLAVALSRALTARIGTTVEPSDFRLSALPDHLRMRFDIVDGDRVVDSDTDLPALRSRLTQHVRAHLNQQLVDDPGPHRQWTSETFGDIPSSLSQQHDGVTVTGYPALAMRSDGVHLVACTTAAEQRSTQTTTLMALLAQDQPSLTTVVKGRPVTERLALTQYPWGGLEALLRDATTAAVARHLVRNGGPVFTVDDYQKLRAAARDTVPAVVSRTIAEVVPALVVVQDLQARLTDSPNEVRTAIESSFTFLIGPQFLSRHPADKLAHLERHLQAIGMRLDLARDFPGRHHELTEHVAEVAANIDKAVSTLKSRGGPARTIRDLNWMLAEYRVSTFAQSLGTAQPISQQRINRAISAALHTEPSSRAKK